MENVSRKKSNWFPWGRVVYVLLALLIAWLAPAEAKSYYRLDANPAQGQPRNFRTMNGEWQREFTGEEPSREGLDTLMASGSGQLTEVTWNGCGAGWSRKASSPSKSIWSICGRSPMATPTIWR